MFATALAKSWERRGPAACLLLPLTLLYFLLLTARRGLYRSGLLRSGKVACTVVVVGNAVAGGAGKTPTAIGLVRHLHARGLRVGVVSRGYRRSAQEACAVDRDSTVQQVGDEPLLIARSTGAPVFVAAKRFDAAKALLSAHPDTEVIVCDDGLQHYALYRDLEICVFDDRGTGNGWLLPSGPLRERWPRRALQRAGQSDHRLLVLHTGKQAAFAGFGATRRLAAAALGCTGDRIPLASLRGPVLALAGIARPEVFFADLRNAGLTLDKTLALPDHFDFKSFDTSALAGYTVLCTQKDANKLWPLWPKALAVPLEQTLEPAFLQAFDAMLDGVRAAKLSSPHGYQTA